jgi:hypothetical protein
MLVSELPNAFDLFQEETITLDLGDMGITSDASAISAKARNFPLDEVAERALATYLNIPYTYLENCPPEFKAQTLRFWRDEAPEAEMVLEVTNGALVNVHKPTTVTIPPRDVAAVMAKVFDPEAEVRKFILNSKMFHLDITTPMHQIEVATEVGDVTQAGVRVLVYPFSDKLPSVTAYMERLVCTNGMCQDERVGQIRIKGQTVDDVISEMESAARSTLSHLDNRLHSYARTAQTTAPGSHGAFAYQLGRELSLRQPVMDMIMDRVGQLTAPATVYDIMNVFTAVANQLPYAQRVKMQTLGGSLAMDTERMVNRCGSCERLLP